MRRKLPFIVLIGLIAFGLGPRLGLVLNTDDAVVRVVPDDAFYYLTVARHIATSGDSTFDGVHPTNGYHPLWMLMLVPAASLNTDSFVRVVLLIGIGLNLGAALVLLQILRHTGRSTWLAVFGAGLYFIWSPVIVASLNGLETSLTTLVFALTFYACVLVESHSVRYEIGVGGLLALLFLARTDTVFYVAAFGVILLIRAQPRSRLRRLLIVSGTALLGVMPWLAWNWLNFGTLLQSSGVAVPYVLHVRYNLAGYGVFDGFAQSWQYFVLFLLGEGRFMWLALPGLVAIILIERIHRRVETDSIERIRQVLWATMALWLAGLALIFVHTFVRWYARPWYFDQLYWLAALPICLTSQVLMSGKLYPQVARFMIGRGRWLGGLAVLTGCALAWLLTTSASQLLTTGVYPWQVELLDGARWLAAHTDPPDAAAAFNAGILGYFSERRVVNLDGVIDEAAWNALQRQELMGFMRQANVRYLVDYDPVMLTMYRPFLGEWAEQVSLTPVVILDRSEGGFSGSHVHVNQLSWSSTKD